MEKTRGQFRVDDITINMHRPPCNPPATNKETLISWSEKGDVMEWIECKEISMLDGTIIEVERRFKGNQNAEPIN